MKKWITIFLFTLFHAILFSQNSPSFTLFFEDANGLRDTIWVGTNPLACDSSLNTSLGERKINDDFPDNLLFKIIGTKVKQILPTDDHIYRSLFSKQNFFYTPPDGGQFPAFQKCGSLHMMMVIKCRVISFPLKITVQRFLSSIDLGNYGAIFMPNANRFSAHDGDSISAYIPNRIFPDSNNSVIFQKGDMTPWPNSDKDYLLFFSIRDAVVGTKDLNTKNLSTLQIFPNPSANTIRLDTGEPINGGRIQFYSATGALLKTQIVQQTEINISDLPRGMIIGVLSKEGLPSSVFRFVKVE